jgi:hypothetical protein
MSSVHCKIYLQVIFTLFSVNTKLFAADYVVFYEDILRMPSSGNVFSFNYCIMVIKKS